MKRTIFLLTAILLLACPLFPLAASAVGNTALCITETADLINEADGTSFFSNSRYIAGDYLAEYTNNAEDDPSGEGSQSGSEPKTGSSRINGFFQVFFIAVMTIGLVGLPAYYVLENRRRRILRESENGEDDENADEASSENNGSGDTEQQ